MVDLEMFLGDPDVIKKIRMLSDDADIDVLFYAQAAFTLTCAYCNVKEVEEGLCLLICMMAADLARLEQGDGKVKSVRRGDTWLSFEALGDPLADYQKRLDLYRKLRW